MGNVFSSSGASTSWYDGLPRVEPSSYETSQDKRDRTLKHLLRANHHNNAVLFNDKKFHNHIPHTLGTAYLFGATAEQLQDFYDADAKPLEEWEDSPGEISRHDWRSFLGKREYQRAFLDFFEDEMVRLSYDWKQVVLYYMLSGPNPLINGSISGLGHPLIHLGYAFEFDNREIAMEALVLAATNYNFLHQYVDHDHPAEDSAQRSPSTATDILAKMRADERLDGLFDSPGAGNIPGLFEKAESVVLEYFHGYDISDVTAAHRELNLISTLLLCATNEPGNPKYDFFICHALTTSYAVRTVLPELPVEHAVPLVRAQWLLTLVLYCIQLRPQIRPELVEAVEIGDTTWDRVKKEALIHRVGGAEVADTHYMKALRTLEQSAKLWKDQEEFYLKAAVKLGREFVGWSGR